MLTQIVLAAALGSGGGAPAPDLGDDVDVLAGLRSDGRFASFIEIVEGTGFTEMLANDGALTVFAPTDNAFAKLPAASLAAFREADNLEAVKNLVRFHLVDESLTLAEIAKTMRPVTLQGGTIAIRWLGGEDYALETATVLDRDLEFTNGIVHVIDEVLLPRGFALVSAADLYGRGEHTYAVDTGHSSVVFRVMHMGVGAQWGWFDEFKGELTVNTEEPEKSSIALAVAVASIDTRDEGRDRFLQSESFFDADNHPGLLFVSTKVAGLEAGNLAVTGDLTLRGVTREVSFTANKLGAARFGPNQYKVGYEADFTIKRSAYGMTFGIPGVAGDEIRLVIALEGTRDLER